MRTLQLSAVFFRQNSQCMEILSVNEHSISHSIQIVNTAQQPVHEVLVEVSGIKDQAMDVFSGTQRVWMSCPFPR